MAEARDVLTEAARAVLDCGVGNLNGDKYRRRVEAFDALDDALEADRLVPVEAEPLVERAVREIASVTIGELIASWERQYGKLTTTIGGTLIDADGMPVEAEPPGLDVGRGYTIVVSSIPALYRSWTHSPNESATRLNRMLLDAAIEWVQAFQRANGREPDDFAEYV